MNTLTKKVVGTLFIGALFLSTSMIGTSVASAYFTVQGKNLQFHAIVEKKESGVWTLLTSSTDPITVLVNNKTKFPFGMPEEGDVVFVVSRIKDNSDVQALIIKKSSSGGPNDIYGTDSDKVSVKKVEFIPSQCPWLRVKSNLSFGTTLVFLVNQNTTFIGAKGCQDLKPGDIISVTGTDTNENGFVAKTVVKHKKGGPKLPDNDEEEDD